MSDYGSNYQVSKCFTTHVARQTQYTTDKQVRPWYRPYPPYLESDCPRIFLIIILYSRCTEHSFSRN